MAQQLCVCLTGASSSVQLATARKFLSSATLFEVRLDFLSPFPSLQQIVDYTRTLLNLGRPLILTARHQRDGGFWPEEREGDRIRLLQSLGSEFGDSEGIFLDLDWGVGALDALARALVGERVGVIRSIHRFDPTWSRADLERIGGQLFDGVAAESPRFVPKIALACEGIAQSRDLFRFGREQKALGRGLYLALGMGEYGLATRILTQWIGSAWTYSTPTLGGPSAAPGQLDPYTLEEVYGYSGLKGSETLFGILGNPLSHSKSPDFHNSRFRAYGFAGVYLPFRTDDLEEARSLMDDLGVQGLSVTIPHKEGVLDWLVDRDDGVRAVGACNTLRRTEGGWKGYNSDIPGFLAPLSGIQGIRHALVLGAGGAARAVVYGLGMKGIEVTITNRTGERARELADDLSSFLPNSIRTLDWAEVGSSTPWDLVVQTTSVGLDGTSEPAPTLEWVGNEIAYDLIYSPLETPFLSRAKKAGCRTINGWPMFESQGEVQSRLFLEKLP